MNLAVVARSAGELDKLKAELEPKGVKVLCRAVDVADRAALQTLVDDVVREFGSIELLINNAGLDQLALYPDFPREQIERIIAVNLAAPMLLTHMILPQMLSQGEGHVVNIASVAGLMGVAYNEAYAATKHALVGFTRSLAATAEGEGWPIGFSCILPSFIDGTGMYEDMKPQSGKSAPFISGISSPEKVVAETLRAIEQRRLEVVVSPAPFRLFAMLLLMFPAATQWALRVTGSIDWFKGAAKARRDALRDAD